MATSVVFPRVQFFANNGRPLIGGRIHTYVAGSSTRAPTYKDAARAQPNTNPIILDGRGEASIYLDDDFEYKFIVEAGNGTLIYTQEPIYGAVKQSDIRFALFVVDSEGDLLANAENFPEGARIEIVATGRRYKKISGIVYPDDDKAAVRYVPQDSSEEQKLEARKNIDAEKRFRYHDMADVSHSGGNQSLLLDGQVMFGDMRGALYEKDIPGEENYSEDLKLNIGGEIYVNRFGWQRCIGKRFGRVVVIGSSSAAGEGTSGYTSPSAANGWTENGTSWVGRMRAALGGEAEIINRSIGGTNTDTSIGRFWTDVAPYSPDTVILATSLVNEPANSNRSRRASNMYWGLLRLCAMCDRIGAKPIVCATMAGDRGDLLRSYSIAQALRQAGVTVWDLSSCVKDINSDTISASYASDGIHANDAGHLRYFQNINRFDLDISMRSANKQPFQQVLGRDGFYMIGNGKGDSDEFAPLVATFTGSRPLDICVHVKVKAPLAVGNIAGAILNIDPVSLSDHPNLSVRPNGTKWSLHADGGPVLTSNVDWDKSGYTSATISYDRGQNRYDYYHDGVFQGSYTPTKMPSTDEGFGYVRAGGLGSNYRLNGWEIHDFIVTRNPSMNGNGLKGNNNQTLDKSLALPSTMGARFSLAGMPGAFGMAGNVEGDLTSRLHLGNALAMLYARS